MLEESTQNDTEKNDDMENDYGEDDSYGRRRVNTHEIISRRKKENTWSENR